MSKYIEEMVKKRKQELTEDMNEELEKFVADLEERAKITIPTDVARILARGGIIERGELNLPYSEAYLSLRMGDNNLFTRSDVNSGQYRITLIVERIGDADQTKGPKMTVRA